MTLSNALSASETALKTSLHFQDADTFYETLLDAHHGLSHEESERFNARLILIMANQLGNTALLQACIAAAREPAGI
jgi:hypothetical protein